MNRLIKPNSFSQLIRMGKKPKQATSSAGKSSTTISTSSIPILTGKGTIEIDPDLIYFTHSRIRPFFTGCNKRIEQTFEEIRQGVTSIEDIPLITVLYNEGCYFSLNNRRLFLWKWLKREGLLPTNTITAFLKNALEREKLKYTPSRCSLVAKLMKEHIKGSMKEPRDEEDEEEEVSDKEEDKEDDKEIYIESNQKSKFNSTEIEDEDIPSSVLEETNKLEEIAAKSNVVIKKTVNHFNLLSMDDDESDEDSN